MRGPRLGLQSKLLLGGAVVMVVSLFLAVLTFRVAQSELEREVFGKLRALRESKAAQIESTFDVVVNEVNGLATNRLTAEALQDLRLAFEDLDPSSAEISASEANLVTYYDEEFAPRVVVPPGAVPLETESLLPANGAATVLQDTYIASNTFPVGDKEQLWIVGDGTEYDLAHQRYHDTFRSFLESSGFYDLFLIDNDGTVIYTVFKEIDFGTNLIDGPHGDSGLGEVFRDATPGRVNIVDFAPYVPSYNQPAAFFATPVMLDGRRVGTVAVQAPIDEINAVMTNNEQWEAVGLGESGETYIVADDLTMRNDSRFLVEDRNAFFSVLTAHDEIPTEVVRAIDTFDSSIGLQPVDTEGTRAAFDGETGETIFPDYRGVPVLSSYRPLDLPGVDWAIMSEIDEAEAFQAVNDLRRATILVLVIGGLGLAAATIWYSRRLSRPLRQLEGVAGELADHDFTSDTPYESATLTRVSRRRDEIGELAQTFERMGGELTTSMHQTLEAVEAREAIESELNVASEIQMSMLPLTFPTPPEHAEFGVYARLVPAKEVGGDFYEFGFVDSDHFFFCVGDVSGKGVPSALFMAATKTLIRSGAMRGEEPGELLTHINGELSRENPEFMFATVWLAVLDLRTGEVVFSNGGHNPPLIRSGSIELVGDRHGPMVGPIRGSTYGQGSLRLAEGDILMLYSDGVTEAMTPNGELFGEDRMSEVVERHEGSVITITENLVDEVLEWEEGDRSDDVTVLTLQYLAPRMVPQFSLTLPTKGVLEDQIIEDISLLNERFATFAVDEGIPDNATQRLQVALDEILVNVASYSSATEATVLAWFDSTRLEVEVSDDGIPFNPLEDVAEADTSSNLEERLPGGLGIHLVRGLMDEIDYVHRKGRNVVTMRKLFVEEGP